MYDDEPPECFTVATPRARKVHICCECGRKIEPGETYERVSGIWDGRPERFKTCTGCVELRKRLDDHPPFGCLRECMQEEGIAEDDLKCPLKQSP